MSERIINGDFSDNFSGWDNGVGGESYTLDAEQARGASYSTSATARTYKMLQNFSLSEEVVSGEITVWCKWLAYYGGISHGSNRFVVKLEKPDTSSVTLLDTTKTGISGNGNLLNGVDIKSHLTQTGTYWLSLTLTTQASMSENPDPPPTYSYGVSYGWYDNISVDVAVKKYKSVHEAIGSAEGIEKSIGKTVKENIGLAEFLSKIRLVKKTTKETVGLSESTQKLIRKTVTGRVGLHEMYSTSVTRAGETVYEDVEKTVTIWEAREPWRKQ